MGTIFTEEGMKSRPFHKQFPDNRDSCRGTPYAGAHMINIFQYLYIDNAHVYTGSAAARFERSTLPGHKSTRTIALTFLRIITPVKCIILLYDGYIEWPKEASFIAESGIILNRARKCEVSTLTNQKVFYYQVFKLLWDA